MSSTPASRLRFRPLLAMALLALAALAGCATAGPDRGEALRSAQYAWSAAIRWGDFEGAWTLVDPAYRAEHPMTPLEFERYGQVQVSAYHALGESLGAGTATRPVEIGVVNRNTQVQREARYLEQWRYDAATNRWWITSGLPDLWQD